ncbi:MAG: hypothetical protein COA65_08410 [Rhodospirillaceae bacterium]|nr:MAG: hypothetical protein COA65_08410 [Rhodospirillaceae bacterium]
MTRGLFFLVALVSVSFSLPSLAKDFTELENGKKLFQENCASCHGEKGKGTHFSSRVDGKTIFIPNLQRSFYVSKLSEDELQQLILRGEAYLRSSRTRVTMPSFDGRLTNAEIRLVAKYLKAVFTGRKIDLPTEARAKKEKKRGKPKRKITGGSGFIVNRRGIAVTALHVVDSCSTIRASIDLGKPLPVTVLAKLPHSEIAIIQLAKKAEVYKHVAFRDAVDPDVGEASYTMGFPLPGLLSSTGNFTFGNVSALNGPKNHPHFLQTTNPIQGGNSGGPLLDDNGLVIGMVSSKLDWLTTASRSGDIPEDVSFAIKGRIIMDRLEIYGITYTDEVRKKPHPPEKIFKNNRKAVLKIICS